MASARPGEESGRIARRKAILYSRVGARELPRQTRRREDYLRDYAWQKELAPNRRPRWRKEKGEIPGRVWEEVCALAMSGAARDIVILDLDQIAPDGIGLEQVAWRLRLLVLSGARVHVIEPYRVLCRASAKELLAIADDSLRAQRDRALSGRKAD